ncbi:Type I restriction modification system N6-adenine DNA methyltransferase (M) subunit, HsdM [Metamycoplasma auris 15026]|uniref:site-specific DNA-methyltransferase (adenine-specific) n=1 Tax=Metamycoplasma auris 15026 TaxID=1188233 RepID=N9TRS6_9BACT|nr:class I SAM-dependent DNA methyltransferase [Metamycoplasma auris]ENY68765.1 Type I restriction modification system N6-adenine DNA methyltransferase (M) subunit, HsdM [Metamycoplasma auris 15026]
MITKLEQQTKNLIDSLKAVCHSYGLSNGGDEYKIITQTFLYKFLNDKFYYDVKNSPYIDEELKQKNKWVENYRQMDEQEVENFIDDISNEYLFAFNPEHLISVLWEKQNLNNFGEIFDDTMKELSELNEKIYITETTEGTQVNLFGPIISENISDVNKRSDFARALINKLVDFSFEDAFGQSYDFFSTIFEYLIKDYNTNGGGSYAEYYTPQSIAKIISELLVDGDKTLKNVSCYDPSAGTGTLVISLSHLIGEDKSSIFTQDISQKSSTMLKMNLILNNLVSSLRNIIVGNTLTNPFHKSKNGDLMTFDFVVSNPPFKMDFADTRDTLEAMKSRFWAGVPNIPKQKKTSMSIYTLFIQHVINSIKPNSGKGAIVVPTGFITAKSGIEQKILERIVKDKLVYGCISMPSNVFANTGTNVSVLFFDKSKKYEKVILIDASKLGEKYKDGTQQRTRLTDKDIEHIISTFREKKEVDSFSKLVSYDEISEKNNSLSAGQYFDIKIDYVDITEEEFESQMNEYRKELKQLFDESNELQSEILEQLGKLKYGKS